ncbi:MAG: right-handed parallel beta-helix repeat-containing protein [Acidimicrobiales bacterium]
MGGSMQSHRLVNTLRNTPRVLLAVGAVTLVGAFGAPGIAGASTKAAPSVRSTAAHVSLFNAGRVHFSHGSAAPRHHAAHRSARPETPAVLYVNGSTGSDNTSCRLHSHPCATISYAILQSPGGTPTTINVAGGNYPEQVVVTTGLNLTIVGAGQSATTIEPSTLATADPDTDSSYNQYAIVDAQPGSKVKLEDLTINGSAAQGQFTGCGPGFDGVYFHDAKGKMTDVTVTYVELSQSDFGCQDGLGIYAAADSGKVTKVTMNSVIVNNYDKNGITCDDAGTTCKVNNSTVTGIGETTLIGQNGIQGYGAGSISLDSDTVTGNSYDGPDYVATGLLLYDNATTTATHVTATSNDVDIYAGNDGDGPATNTISLSDNNANNATNYNGLGGVGIGLDSGVAGSVTGNTATGDVGGGIYEWGSSGMTIESNTASSDYLGIYIGGEGSDGLGSTSMTVSQNTVSRESYDGILADTDATGNNFTSNIAKHDLNYAYQDLSTGSETAGTANTWTGNECTPSADSNPEGLC